MSETKMKPGTYRTRGGHTAHVMKPWWDGENKMWTGTTEGVGWSDWHEDGRSLDGDPDFDIVLEGNEAGG